MQVGKIEQLTTEKPPRTMIPTTFARQEATIRRLQTELDEAKEKNLYLTEAHYTEYSRAEKLQTELDAANGSVNQWMEWYDNAAAEHDAVLGWSRSAYTRLQALMTIGVSLTPDAVTAALLDDAPDAVKGGDK